MPSPLRRLPFSLKLLLAFALVVVVSVGTVAAIANASAVRQFESYISSGAHPRLMQLLPSLQSYYAQAGTWEGVGSVVSDSLLTGGMGRGRGAGQAVGTPVIIADASRKVVYDSGKGWLGERLSKGALRDATALTVGGDTVGYAFVSTGPLELEFTRGLNASIVWAGLAAGAVAIALALLLTRTVVRPIRAVRDAAQRIAAGDLSRRVPVASSDEIGDLAQQFNEMAGELERNETLRRKMMADISHELRTPLAVMQAQVEALNDGIFELSLDNLEPISDQTHLLGRLVNDLRDLALAEAGRLPLQRTDMDLNRTIARVTAAFQSRAQEKHLELSDQLAPDLPSISADSQRLEQVLGNLLSNAIRHTPDGGRIVVSSRREGDAATFQVADSGPGISGEDLPYVFDRFYRSDKARTRADGGTGLGLAIAKQLVEAHGGAIAVSSEPGQGAVFLVRLPLKP